MALINRIQISNFMNAQRKSPWRPDWIFETFELNCQSTAINIPNGAGKTTLFNLILAMFVWDKKVIESIRKLHFAPKSYGKYTHIRIEVLIQTEKGASNYTIFDDPKAFRTPFVIGLYGNKGENEQFRLYTYEGSLEECQIGETNGLHKILKTDSFFKEQLDKLPSRFPRSQRENTRQNWRRRIATFFNLSSLEQQLTYQKQQGAEGSGSYFNIKSRPHMSYAASFFYTYIAPELLVDLLRGQGEEDEYGIEDTIHEKTSRIISARHKAKLEESRLKQTKKSLILLTELLEKATKLKGVQKDFEKYINEIATEKAVLKQILIDEPILGVPNSPTESDPEFCKYLVWQENAWYIPDYALALFTDEKSRVVNQKADRKHIERVKAKTSQVLEITCDHGSEVLINRKQGGGIQIIYIPQIMHALLLISRQISLNHGLQINRLKQLITLSLGPKKMQIRIQPDFITKNYL